MSTVVFVEVLVAVLGLALVTLVVTTAVGTPTRAGMADMRRWLETPAARLRSACVIAVGIAVAMLLPSLLAAQTDPRSALVVAALAIAVASLVASLGRAAGSPPAVATAQACTTDHFVSCRSGGVTDPPRYPLRPRAPGLV